MSIYIYIYIQISKSARLGQYGIEGLGVWDTSNIVTVSPDGQSKEALSKGVCSEFFAEGELGKV